MNFDIFVGIVLLFYLVVGLARRALRSFFGLVLFVAYLLGIVYVYDISKVIFGNSDSLFILFKNLFFTLVLLFAAYLVILFIVSIIFSKIYKNSSVSGTTLFFSRIFSVIFSLINGVFFCVVMAYLLIFLLDIYGENFPFNRKWVENSKALFYTSKTIKYIPKEIYSKYKKPYTVLKVLLNPELRKNFIKTEVFKKMINIDGVRDSIKKLEQEKALKIKNPIEIVKNKNIVSILSNKKLYELLVSDLFYKTALGISNKSEGRTYLGKVLNSRSEEFSPNAVLYLKNGNVVKCKIVKRLDDRVIVQFGQEGIETVFFNDEIKKIVNIEN